MDNILLSILLVILGLIFGIISVLIINHIRKNNTSKSITEMLDKAQKQLQTADKTLTEIVGRRTKAINRTLRGVEELTETDSPMFSKLEDTVDE